MGTLMLLFPDGSKAPVETSGTTHGRGTHESLVYSFLSRQHMSLAPVEGVEGVVMLTNLGRNPLIVEVLQPGSTDRWEQTATLQQHQDACIGPISRFFVASRPDTTTITLTLPGGSNGSNGGVGAGAIPVGAAAGAAVGQIESDAALAAALAAEEEEAAAAAAAAGASAERDSAAHGLPPAKRHKPDLSAAATTTSAAAAAAAGSGAGSSAAVPAPPSLGETPYSLLAVNNAAFNAAWNAGCLGARLSQLVAGEIQLALVSNFMVDFGFFPSHCCPELIKAKQVVLVEGLAMRQKGPNGSGWGQRAQSIATAAETAFQAAAADAGVPPPELCCHSPETEGWGTHHTKAFVLGFPDGGVRVLVHTANLVVGDCNSKTQGLWWQDFPPKQQQQQQRQSEFERTLSAYLRSLQLPGPWGERVQQVVAGADFSAARGVLIGSIPGRHAGPSRELWGHMALRTALSQLQMPHHYQAAETILQCSSLGVINQRWLDEFQDSLNAGRYSAAPAAPAGSGQQQQQQRQRRPRLHFVWPTAEDVRGSNEGWSSGGSIPTQYRKITADCLQPLFRRWGGAAVGRQEAMPHIKTFGRFLAVATPQQQQQQQQPQPPLLPQQQHGSSVVYELPWWLVTSHNLSKAAWGELQKGGQQLFIRSYELGVLCLPELEAAYRRHPHRFYCCTQERVGVVPSINGPGPVRFVAWNQPGPHNSPDQQQQQQQQGTAPTAAAAEGGSGAVGSSSGNGQDVHVVYVPVAHTLPPQRYNSSSDRPWCLDEHFPGLDRFGRRCPNMARKLN